MGACGMCGAVTPRRVYHRGSKTIVTPSDNAAQQLLLKWCPPVCGACGLDPDNAKTPAIVATVGVTLAPGFDELDPTLDWSSAFLRIEYGSGDPDKQTVDIDLMNGVSFPLMGGGGSTVNFYIVYPSVSAQEMVSPPIEVSLSVGVHGFGGTGPRSARRTVFVGTLTAGQPSNPFPIPRYAVGAVFCSDGPETTLTWHQTNSPGSAVSMGEQTISKMEYDSVPVLHAARGFTITGTSEEGNTKVRVIFYLAPA